MATLHELTNNGYAALKARHTDAPGLLADNLASIQYLEYLARQVAVDAGQWDVDDVLRVSDQKAGDTPQVYKKQPENINEVFFKRLAEAKPSLPGLDFSPHALAQLAVAAKNMLQDSRVSEMREDCRRSERALREREDQILGYLRQLHTSRQQLHEILGNPSTRKPLVDQIVEIERRGLWKFLGFNPEGTTGLDTSILYFASVQDIVIDHMNPTTHMRVNMGRYSLKITLDNYGNPGVQIGAYERNTSVDGTTYIHPHAAHFGSLCWGTAGPARNKFALDGDIVGISDLVIALLRTYGEGNGPYIYLNHFQKQRIEDLPPGIKPELFDICACHASIACPDPGPSCKFCRLTNKTCTCCATCKHGPAKCVCVTPRLLPGQKNYLRKNRHSFYVMSPVPEEPGRAVYAAIITPDAPTPPPVVPEKKGSKVNFTFRNDPVWAVSTPSPTTNAANPVPTPDVGMDLTDDSDEEREDTRF